MTPVAFCVEVSHKNIFLKTELYSSYTAGDFSRHKSFSAQGTFVIEENTVASIHAIRLTVVLGYPVSVYFSNSVRASRIKRRCFRLWSFLYFSKQLAGRCLINTCFLF